MAYGVTSDGFVPKTLENILDSIEARERASNSLGTNINTSAHTVLGQLNGIYAEKIRELWELAESIYSSRNPDNATDEALDELAALCPGIIREDATYSTVTATVNLDAGITLSIGSVASVANSPNSRFVTTELITNTGGVAADFGVAMQAEDTGPVYAAINTLTVIETPVSGWNSITNNAAADPGRNVETNSAFRIRREATVRLSGAANVDAIAADLLEVDGVDDVLVMQNVNDVVTNGLEPHSIWVVIWDGATADADSNTIADTIFDSKAGGIATNGNTLIVVEDSMEVDHNVYFDRATQLTLYVEVDVVGDNNYAGNNAVQTAIQDLASAYEISNGLGKGNVYASKIIGEAVDVTGVVNVSEVRLGWSASPSGTDDLDVPVASIAVLQSVVVSNTII